MTKWICKKCRTQEPCHFETDGKKPYKREYNCDAEWEPEEPEQEEPALPKLTAEIFNHPDCPPDAIFAVVNRDGTAAWGIGEMAWPSTYSGRWIFIPEKSGAWCKIPGEFDATDWKHSFVVRPEPKPEQKTPADLAEEIVREFKRTIKNKAAPVALEILRELERAKEKHPHFPLGLIEQVAIMAEEAGEAIREANRIRWNEGGTFAALRAELIQTATMCVRVIENMGEDPE